MIKVLISISSHGYGHLAQCRSLIWGLKKNGFNGKFIIQCTHSADFIKHRLGLNDIEVVHVATEPTIPMKDVLTVDIEKLWHLYHPDNLFDQLQIDQNIQLIKRCDAVISNVGFYPLLAAQQLNKKNAAFCCLNWADIVDYYAGTTQKKSVKSMREIYNHADFFSLTRPFMNAPWLKNTNIINPIITPNHLGEFPKIDQFDKEAIKHIFITSSDNSMPVDLNELPRIENLIWHINSPKVPRRSDIKRVASNDFDQMLDVCDICMTKPGYGLFTECAYRQKPVISINRLDWPEQEQLLIWMRRYARLAEVPISNFSATTLTEAVKKLRASPPPETFQIGNNQLARNVINWLKSQ